MKLFPISALSRALTDADVPRDPQTIRLWFKEGKIPPTPFFVGNPNKPLRLFTQEQIDLIVNVAKDEDILQGHSMESFKKRIWSELVTLHQKYVDAQNAVCK